MNEYSISLRSSAKINLTLDVLGLRADGYHELRSVVHTIGIFDTIRLRFGGSGLRFRCDDLALQSDDNLCVQAARLWAHSANRVLDCEISLEKTIPTGAGLGGGSGNAAAMLLALNKRFGDALSNEQLHELAAQLGADVPLFLRGGCALIEGIGERITPLRALSGWIALLQPPQKLATPQVFRAWDALHQSNATPDFAFTTSENASGNLLAALRENAPLAQLATTLRNDLTSAAAFCGVDVAPHLQKLRACGALGAAMTGSGSAFYGLFASEHDAKNALQKMQSNMEYPTGAAQRSEKNAPWGFAAIAPFCVHGVELFDEKLF